MYSLSLLLLSIASLVQGALATDCSCGYYDPANNAVYTDAIIVYFNETSELPEGVFTREEFEHKKEKGYNAIYRRGGMPENAIITNTSILQKGSLQLFVDPPTKEHLVQGAGIASLRKDILYGSFRASMKSPPPLVGGSALSMILQHNVSSSLEMDLCNTNMPDTARVTYLENGEYPDVKFGTNYTTLANASLSPWDFIELRMDWSQNYINYTIANNQTRSIHKKGIPFEPLPLAFQHWSTGDMYWTEGPPIKRSVANVAWVRAFFNSSLTSNREYTARCNAANLCSVDDVSLRGSSTYRPEALVAWKEPPRNKKWRISSAVVSGIAVSLGMITLLNVVYRRQPLQKYLSRKKSDIKNSDSKSDEPESEPVLETEESRRDSFGATVVKTRTHVTYRKAARNSVRFGTVEYQLPPSHDDQVDSDPTGQRESRAVSCISNPDRRYSRALSAISDFGDNDNWGSGRDDGYMPTPFQSTEGLLGRPYESTDGLMSPRHIDVPVPRTSWDFFERPREILRPILDIEVPRSSWDFFEQDRRQFYELSAEPDTKEENGADLFQGADEGYHLRTWARNASEALTVEMPQWGLPPWGVYPTITPKPSISTHTLIPADAPTKLNHNNKKIVDAKITVAVAPQDKVMLKEKRVDYLAGLVTFACLGVTVMHFMLTFVPYAGGINNGMHYKSEFWFRWTLQPFYLNPIWLGPFFVTSCRFLAGKYIRHGKLSDIAEKVLLRAVRMVLPCVFISMLEYFFLEQGLLDQLEWLPSISWSTWPWISKYKNFGVFINDALELAYLIPNAAPQMTNHFCTGILWTVPVQLQFTYTALLAVVMVRDIRTPWKRMGFYAFCIVLNWYSKSWGSCFWAGVLLADLQLTYQASKWIQARPRVHYPFCILMAIIALSSGLFSMLEDRLHIPILSGERGIHPDIYTGLPIYLTERAGYPDYFEPRLFTLMFSISMQLLVETSTCVQWLLSLPIWQPIFPYAYTIYLIHGFVFWSLGSLVAIKLSVAGLPYWANMLITALVCYSVMAVGVKLISALTEDCVTKACQNIGRWASGIPVPKRTSLWPFDRSLLDRKVEDESRVDEESRLNQVAASSLDEEEEPKDGTVHPDLVDMAWLRGSISLHDKNLIPSLTPQRSE